MQAQRPEPSRAVLLLLIALSAVGPLSFQIVLPALPEWRRTFGAEAGTTQLVVSVSMALIAVATLTYGRVADRWGRRPPLLVGMSALAVGSLACALAPSLPVLIVGRAVQAAGGASGMVVSRAIVLDLYGRERARKAQAAIGAAMMGAPLAATPLGGLLTDLVGWRATFAVICVSGLLMLTAVALGLRETLDAKRERHRMAEAYGALLRDRSFLGYALQPGFAMAAFLGFLTGGAYVFADRYRIGPTGFGLHVLAVTSAFLVGSLAASRTTTRLPTDRAVVLGSLLALLAAAAALGLTLAGVWTPWALTGPVAALALANGLALPNAQAGAVSVREDLSGDASGLSGFINTVVGAVASQLVGALQDGTPRPLAWLMAGASALAVLASLLTLGRAARR